MTTVVAVVDLPAFLVQCSDAGYRVLRVEELGESAVIVHIVPEIPI